jgi:hypothetical protein
MPVALGGSTRIAVVAGQFRQACGSPLPLVDDPEYQPEDRDGPTGR